MSETGMMERRKARLTPYQRDVLFALKREPGDGWLKTDQIAEACGHRFDTAWAGSKLPSLFNRGLVERSFGYYRITDAGRAALSPEAKTGEGRE